MEDFGRTAGVEGRFRALHGRLDWTAGGGQLLPVLAVTVVESACIGAGYGNFAVCPL
jgi:hypothetical protein